ncbi:hypothetical protein GQ55_2G140200 [Panicum hallii var. hallii]|uniref:Uncharacterized protein n=1 Tax=Panicum hallii var. hallii TaxID=1504633 RepID=A0A2T7EPN1_9POAL|nr:hypothetical protein GQ55_2G140200 [Panicum hallii var. hallii]
MISYPRRLMKHDRRSPNYPRYDLKKKKKKKKLPKVPWFKFNKHIILLHGSMIYRTLTTNSRGALDDNSKLFPALKLVHGSRRIIPIRLRHLLPIIIY